MGVVVLARFSLQQFAKVFTVHNSVPVKGWLGAANRVMKLTSTVRGRKAAKQIEINWREILPLDNIATSKNEKVAQFREKRLPRWKAT